jgi:hypothetical protein
MPVAVVVATGYAGRANGRLVTLAEMEFDSILDGMKM